MLRNSTTRNWELWKQNFSIIAYHLESKQPHVTRRFGKRQQTWGMISKLAIKSGGNVWKMLCLVAKPPAMYLNRPIVLGLVIMWGRQLSEEASNRLRPLIVLCRDLANRELARYPRSSMDMLSRSCEFWNVDCRYISRRAQRQRGKFQWSWVQVRYNMG